MKLTTQQIMEQAPSALMTKATFDLWLEQEKNTNVLYKDKPRITDKYSFLSTADVIDSMESCGWHVVSARQTARLPIGLHEIEFQSPDLEGMFDIKHGIVPRIKFLNAHTGNFAIRSFKSINRQVCSNGLVVETTDGFKRLPHVGSISEKVNLMITDYLDSIKEVSGVVLESMDTTVHHKTAISMANKALVARGLDPKTIDHKEILAPKRDADSDNNLWTVFNRIQESVIRGGFHINLANGDKPYQLVADEITNPSRSAKINISLWNDMVEVLAKK